jgi:hypothetical protein
MSSTTKNAAKSRNRRTAISHAASCREELAMQHFPTRREALATLTATALAGQLPAPLAANEAAGFQFATFQAEVTPRLGHPLLGSNFAPAQSIDDPLLAKGFVLLGPERPIVLCAIDWCEIRNEAYSQWRKRLADAVGTTLDRVLVTCVHQHDAPYFDLGAQKLLAASPGGGLMCDAEFHARMVERVAQAAEASLRRAQPLTHLGLGQAKVEKIASNRRVEIDGKVSFRRYSRAPDKALRDLPEGTIDPWLKTVSFWNGERPLAALSSYACHPMSYYGRGDISTDFVGHARQLREQEEPQVFQIYTSGCCGDVTAGKYNDGATSNRQTLTERLQQALRAAWQATRRVPLTRVGLRSVPLLLAHGEQANLSAAALRGVLQSDAALNARIQAALGLSSIQRNPAGHAIDVQAVDFGPAQLVLLPAESFVAYQLLAQKLRPNAFVMAIGFGECAPGYIPTDAAFREGYRAEHRYCWVAPGAEGLIASALARALAP